MSVIHPFKALRPLKEHVDKVASLPYDVMNRAEAAEMAKGNPHSFLHVVRADIDFADDVDTHADEVYTKSQENLEKLEKDGIMKQDEKPCLYVYRQVMNGNAQTGIVACASIDEYINDKIKKHERTLEVKEQDRIRHFDTCDANTAPIFLTYRHRDNIDEMVASVTAKDPVYDFVSEDDIQHVVWIIDDSQLIDNIVQAFADDVEAMYIADGHHRCASATKVGLKRREEKGENPEAEYNYFMAVIFPDKDLMVMDYNRVVKDLNGLSSEEFMQKVKEVFEVEEHKGSEPFKPAKSHEFGMYLDGKWYKLVAKDEIINDDDPVEKLDVQILQKNLLDPVLGIKDPRKDSRIDFVGGIRGLKELEKRCNDDMKVAFSMYPTSVEELMNIADEDQIMPPKSTWFEPKLRSGLFVHKLSD